MSPTKKAPKVGGAAGATVDQVAALLNLTPRRVQQLVAERIMPRAERGRYDLPACVRAYVVYLQRAVETAQNRASLPVVAELTTERVRRLRQENAQGDLDMQERLGRLIPLDLHEARVSAMCERLVAACRGGLSRHNSAVVAASSVLEAQLVLQNIGDGLFRAIRGEPDDPDDPSVESGDGGARPVDPVAEHARAVRALRASAVVL